MSRYVHIAKREGNNKRGFLIVNPRLGKHIAKNPTKVLSMFDDMAALKPRGMNPSKTLVIGFAETATALGLHYAAVNHCYYMQTTREHVPGNHVYLYFSEEHSHATAQYIVKDAFAKYLKDIDRVIFVDDEITTGKTVLNAIAAMKREFPKLSLKFAVISILNSMTKEQRRVYDTQGIDVLYLSKISNESYEEEASSYTLDGKVSYVKSQEMDEIQLPYAGASKQLPDTRLGVYGPYYYTAVQDLWYQRYMKYMKPNVAGKKVLVLGTEECMYAGLMLASALYDMVDRVKFHATTRSPISVSRDVAYPVHHRYCFDSLYEKGRDAFVYDLKQYDMVYVIVESQYMQNPDGLKELFAHLKKAGNENIKVIGV